MIATSIGRCQKQDGRKGKWGLFLKPQPPHTRQKYEHLAPKLPHLPCFGAFGAPNCRICLVLEHLGSYIVQTFVHIFALYVGGGRGQQRISEEGQQSVKTWAAPKASHLPFPRFAVRIFRVFRAFVRQTFLRPLVSCG